MKKNIRQVVDWILEDEGGFTREHGLGGATNHGITHTFFSEVRKKQNKAIPTTEDLKNLTSDEAGTIYESYVLPLVEFNKLPSGLDYVMANLATMDGPTGARKILQKVLGIKVNGIWDKDIWKAINNIDPSHLATKVLLFQLREKMKDSRIEKYGLGWANRSVRVLDRAYDLINKDMKQGV